MNDKENQNKDSFKSWMVAIGCCTLNTFLQAPYRIAGLIYVALIERYETNRSKASLPMFLYLLIMSIGGPIVAAMGQSFGLEETVILGATLVSVSVGATYFAESIEVAILFLGIVYGIGMSLSMLLVSNILKKHFKKSFNTASGINRAGGSIAGFIFPPIFILLLNTFGVPGAFLITGGILLHAVPAAMLIKVAKISTQNRNINQTSTLNNKVSTQIRNSSRVSDITYENKSLGNKLKYISKENASETLPTIEIQTVADIKLSTLKCNGKSKNSIESSVQNVVTINSNIKKGQLCEENSNKKERLSYWKTLAVLKEPSFMIITSLQSIYSFSLTIVVTTLIDYSRDKMIPREYEVLILTASSVFDIIGRLGLVWIVDKDYMSYTTFTVIANFTMGASVVFLVVARNFIVFMIGALIFGMSSGTLLVILPNLLFKFLEKEKHVMASSCRIIAYAPLSFAASPLIEYFRGKLKSYDGLYCIVIGLCLLCSLATPLVSRFSKVRSNNEINCCNKSFLKDKTTA